VVADARNSGSDRLEALDPSARHPLPGRVIDRYGQDPALSLGGKLIYQVPEYTRNGGDAGETLYLTGSAGGRKRVAFRSRRDFWGGWGPGERVAVVYDGSSRIMLDPGGRRQRTIVPGLRRVDVFQTNRRGEVFALGAPRRALSIVTPEGRARSLTTPWNALAWTPDGRSILAARRDRLGLMSPSTGSVRVIGRVSNGQVFDVAWAR
jgi:hypothetical protein